MSILSPQKCPLVYILLMFLYMQPVLAENQPGDNTYLQVARDQLGLASDKYNAGDIAASKENLKKASDWLNKAVMHSKYEKVKIEAEKLASDIDALRLTLSHSSTQNDIVRFLHNSTSLIVRESEHLIHDYIVSSNDNTTLRHMLDAKRNFFLAEHDLFFSHDLSNALQELNESLKYLGQASEIARPDLKARVNNLVRNIKILVMLSEKSRELWNNKELIDSLDRAMNHISNAESIAAPPMKLRLKSVEQNIKQLKEDFKKTNIKNKYDSISSDFARVIESI